MPYSNEKYAGLFDINFSDTVKDIQKSLIENAPDLPPTSVPSQSELPVKSTPKPEIKKDVTKDMESVPPRQEPIIYTKDKKDKIKRKKKEVPSKELGKEFEAYPEVLIFNYFMPDVFEADIDLSDIENTDVSMNTFAYLKELGYKTGMWEVSAEFDMHKCHGDEPGGLICWKRMSQTYSLEDILETANNHASEKGYYPPKPFMAHAHPGCRCSILCWSPVDIKDIPDSAPGLPINARPEELKKYKKDLLAKLEHVSVDRWSYIPTHIWKNSDMSTPYMKPESIQANSNETTKIAEADWENDIKPIKIKESFMYQHSMGIMRPISNTYIGFQLSKKDGKGRVYLSDLGNVVELPHELYEELQLSEPLGKYKDLDANMYIIVNDSIGIVLFAPKNEKPLCYFPDFDSNIFIEDYQILEIKK